MTVPAVAIIIPALNEAGNIGALVREVLAQPVVAGRVEVIVVDNGSTDGTAQLAAAAGARVVTETRRGYGYACAAGAAAASAELLVFLDGDYSSLPAELAIVITPLEAGSAGLVLGSRTKGDIAHGAMPPHQRFGNWLASTLMRRLYNIEVTDLGPYRSIRRSLLEELRMREMTYGWPTEMMVKAARRGVSIMEVPVSHHPRRSGKSKVSGTLRGSALAAYYILGVTLRYAWGAPPQPAPPKPGSSGKR
jgi:glycosyltransferase involved in cell wall biosynthesis